MTATQTHFREATTPADLATIRQLFREYGQALAENPSGAAGICIQNFTDEIKHLPGPYEALLLAEADGQALGCVALKPVKPKAASGDTDHACEMKRLWVRPAARGRKLGRDLVLHAMQTARDLGYHWMYLDTAPEAMPAAQNLYRSLGFESIERFNDNPVPGIVFFRRNLTA